LQARARRILPVPVVRNRLAAPRLLFIFGMTTFSFPLRGRVALAQGTALADSE
jgi:hypothetical protein